MMDTFEGKKFDRWMFELFGSETDHEIDQAMS
jgi:hypothetical protein